MVEIHVDTEVMRLLWTRAVDSDRNENDILLRLLSAPISGRRASPPRSRHNSARSGKKHSGDGSPTWWQLAREALCQLGGEAGLQEIYAKVREIAPEVTDFPTFVPTLKQAIRVNSLPVAGPKAVFENVGYGRWRLLGGDAAPTTVRLTSAQPGSAGADGMIGDGPQRN